MSCGMLETDGKMTKTGDLNEGCNSLDFASAEEATPLSCEHLKQNGKAKLALFSNENDFLGAVGDGKDQNLINSEPGSKFSNEITTESTELANALLSLSGKNSSIIEKDQNLKNIFSKNGCHPYNNPQNSQSSIPICNNNTWIGNSAALIGYPLTYGINHLPQCGCPSNRAYQSQEWIPLQQHLQTQDFQPLDVQGMKQKQCFTTPFQQPWFLTPGALPSNFPNCNPVQNISKLSSALQQQQQQQQLSSALQQQQQQQLSQMSMELLQQRYAQQMMKMSAENPQQLQAPKQDIVNPSSVALVAPMILDFNQNRHVQGIPLIYNVNQWLNMPSCNYPTSSSGGQAMNYACKSQNELAEQTECEKKGQDVYHKCASSSSSTNTDAITQLGEAANLILLNPKNFMTSSTDYDKQDSLCCRNFDVNNISQAGNTETQLDKNVQQLEEAYTQSQQIYEKKQTLSTKSASKNLKNRTCSYCKRVFARPFTLKSHIRRHTKEKPFTCQICYRSFSQSATLENHKLTHSGLKPHQCNTCFKRFAHQTSLKTHLRIHSGEQPYQCGYCNRRFSDGSTLQKHKRTHNGERPFRCLFCEKCFSQSGNMRRHMASTHKADLLASQGNTDLKQIK